MNSENGLVSINPKKSADGAATAISRRGFLKVLGSASAVGVAGCADNAKQKILPNFRGEEFQVPGVAQWYRSTCTECSAGCGITVRTREGRVVKVEGNKEDPISRGGLCGLGQSAVQALYDPDRIRQPLEKQRDDNNKVVYRPISWAAALDKVAGALRDSHGKAALFTGETTGALSELMADWNEELGVSGVTFDAMQPVDLARASELVFGEYGIPEYHLERADFILSIGADFLETWVAPVSLARRWAEARTKELPAKMIHVEPRLSLTGGNADSWISIQAGGELALVKMLVRLMLEKGMGADLRSDIRQRLVALTSEISLGDVESKTGVSREKVLLLAEHLGQAEAPVIIAGGSAARSNRSVELFVLSHFLNLITGAVGKTVNIASMRKPKTSIREAVSIINRMDQGEIDILMVHNTNPAFNLPADLGFGYARRKVKLMVSFSTALDETAELADIILPASHSLESFGDVRALPGVYSLVQPSMTPVFDTREFGDILIELARKTEKGYLVKESEDFYSYLKQSWRALHAERRVAAPFERWWKECLERGVFVDESQRIERAPVRVSEQVFDLNFAQPTFSAEQAGEEDPVLLPFPSVKSFDGRAANRPWLQEMPDPVSQVSWDAWAEIHPKTAERYNLKQGDMVAVRNFYGEVNVPAYVTEYVHPGVIAIPMGQGHTSYGRFARELAGNGNVMTLLPGNKEEAVDSLSLLSTRVAVRRSPRRDRLVVAQGSDSQHDRHIANTRLIDEDGKVLEKYSDHLHYPDGAKQMYEQRKHPLYKWGMSVDLAACTGCSACVVACYAENNIPVVGKKVFSQGREMSWLRIERYVEGPAEELQVNFMPVMCQHCNNAPCEPVCPVYATYHNEEGLNVMVYNRCVGTRYCSNNCPYKVRRFNWFEYEFPEPLNWQLNPDVTKRVAGVMEKCTFCVQRINEAKDRAKDEGRPVQDGEVQPACVQSCPTQALSFGNLNDENSKVSKLSKDSRAYKVLDDHINTQPAVSYLEDVKYKI